MNQQIIWLNKWRLIKKIIYLKCTLSAYLLVKVLLQAEQTNLPFFWAAFLLARFSRVLRSLTLPKILWSTCGLVIKGGDLVGLLRRILVFVGFIMNFETNQLSLAVLWLRIVSMKKLLIFFEIFFKPVSNGCCITAGFGCTL